MGVACCNPMCTYTNITPVSVGECTWAERQYTYMHKLKMIRLDFILPLADALGAKKWRVHLEWLPTHRSIECQVNVY